MPDVPSNTEGPLAKDPSKCLNWWSYGERLAEEAFSSPGVRGSKKLCRAVTPAAEAVSVPASQAAVPPSRSTLTGAELPQAKKKSLVFMHAGSLQSCSTQLPCRLWPARLLC